MRRILLTVALSGIAVSANSAPAQTNDPIIGKWNLNVAKSKFTAPPPKTATLVFASSGPDGVKAVFDGVAATGDKVHQEYTANYDGKDYPMTGNPNGDTISLKRINANTVETTYKVRGKATVTNVRTVSADGKTLTVTSKGTDANGQKVEEFFVFEKA